MSKTNNTVLKNVRHNGQKVKKWYHNGTKVYSVGNVVTYYFNSNDYAQEEIDSEASCLTPKTVNYINHFSGWTFVGWREDKTASSSVLSSKVMGDEPVTLYAVYRRSLTATFNGNGATSGSVASISGTQYYNNGNTANPAITLPACGYSKTNYKFNGWNYGAVGAKITLTGNITVSAQWIQAVYAYGYTGGMQSFTAPVAGTYLLQVWGAEGSNGNGASDYAKPGKGGYAAGYVSLSKGQVIYICVGANGNRAIRTSQYAYNGGGRSTNSPGGGATHIGTRNAILMNYGNTSGLFIVAGGGGGAGWGDNPNGGASGRGYQGGNGGGSSGGYGYAQHYAGAGYEGGAPGTQTGPTWLFGHGGWDSSREYRPAGGGGLYGGVNGVDGDDFTAGAGGGSGYIGGVTSGSWSNGTRSGDGYAKITLT